MPTLDRKKIKLALDTEVKQIARERDGCCLMCGANQFLTVHHFIKTVGSSSKYQFDIRNMITLCGLCHSKAHHDETRWKPDLYSLAVKNGILSEVELYEIETDHKYNKTTTLSLLELLQKIRKVKKDHKGC